jgi:sulfite dehydrogenase (cytochrome) subunit B
VPLRYLIISPLLAFLISLLLIALVVYRPADTPAAAATKPAQKSAGPEVIADPSQMPPLAEAPGQDVFLANCINCHSARYVLTQPRFSRKVWTAEVAKMVSAYKASIPAAQQAQIVDYLVAGYGSDAGK